MGIPGYYVFNAALGITLFGASTGTIVPFFLLVHG